MKKLLIASAALAMVAGTAQAQSSVTVYGLLDIGYSNATNTYTESDGGVTKLKNKNTGNGDGGLATSRLGVRGVEDLGGGLKANFVLEYDLVDAGVGGTGSCSSKTAADAKTTFNAANCAATDTSTGFGARYSWVGLEDAKLGQLRLGRQEQSIHSVVVGGSAGFANNTAGALYSAGFNSGANDASVRPHGVFLNRAISYISPAVNGFRVELQTSNNEVTDTANVTTFAKEFGGSLKYSAGKLNVAYGMAETKLNLTTASSSTITGATDGQLDGTFTAGSATSGDRKVTVQALAASYDFGVVQGFALHTQNKTVNPSDAAFLSKTKITEIGLRAPMGKTVFFVSGFDGSRDGDSNATNLNAAADVTGTNMARRNGDVSGFQVGAVYNLSKRTAAYAIIGEQEIKAKTGASAGAKIESKSTAVGVRHSF
jgi:predicted porin